MKNKKNAFFGKEHSLESKKTISLSRKQICKSGVYKIICLINSKIYIGISNSVNRRLNEHRNSLKRGLHANRTLQKDFDLYKERSFLFQPIDFCSSTNARVEEKRLIAKYPIEFLYNINKKPFFKGQTHSESVKKNLSIQNNGKSNKEKRKSLFLNSIYYESICEASEKTGIHRRLIRERCHSQEPKWANYQWVPLNQKKL